MLGHTVSIRCKDINKETGREGKQEEKRKKPRKEIRKDKTRPEHHCMGSEMTTNPGQWTEERLHAIKKGTNQDPANSWIRSNKARQALTKAKT